MSEHRKLQRTLFRMQVDPAFAEALHAGEPRARASTGLGAADLALLAELDAAALHADRDGKRHRQVLGNLASEFTLGLARAAAGPATRELLARFPRSEAFHATVAADGRLPLAFGAYARDAARAAGDARLAALFELELAMAELRRFDARPGDPPPRGSVALVPGARILEVASGTLDDAERLRAALDAGEAPPAREAPPPAPNAVETVLLVAGSRPAHGLADVHAERLEPPADALFRELDAGPMDAAARGRLARRFGADPEELERFVDGFAGEGIVRRGV